MKKFFEWLATINFVLPLVGYVLITSIFFTSGNVGKDDISSVTQDITIPYRIFTLLIALLVIFIAHRRPIRFIPKQVKWLFVFWTLLALRIFYDLEIREDLIEEQINRSRTFLYILICVIPAISILFSHDKVNYRYAFHLVFGGFIVSLILMLIYNPLLLIASDELVQRVAGNIAFSTLQLAAFSGSIIIMCFYSYSFKVYKYNKVLLFFLSLFAIIALLRSASRGPTIAFIVVMGMYITASYNQPLKIVIGLIIIIIFVYIFSGTILNFLNDIAPVLVKRFAISGSDDFTNGRNDLYTVAIEKFLDSPIYGDSFAIFSKDPIAQEHKVYVNDLSNSGYIWSHNMILDAFMGLGIIGGGIFLYIYISFFKKAFKLFKNKDPRVWFVMLAVLRVLAGFFSGAFYLSDSLTFCIVVIFLIRHENSNLCIKDIKHN